MGCGITEEGQDCIHCGVPVGWEYQSGKPRKNNQKYYFKQWLKCPWCRAIYIVEKYKVVIPVNEDIFLDTEE